MDPRGCRFLASVPGVMHMMYDDDTGRRVHLEIRSEDRPVDRDKPTRPPSKHVRELILNLLRVYPVWEKEPARIHAYIRNRLGRHDVSLKVVRLVLRQEKAKQRR